METKQRGIEIGRRWLSALTQAVETRTGRQPKSAIAEASREQAAGAANPQIVEYVFEALPGAALWIAGEADAVALAAGSFDDAARGLRADAPALSQLQTVPEYGAAVFAIQLEIEGAKAEFFLGVSDVLIDSSHAQAEPPTLDLLLDVELPLSVSFGRTYLPVRDILKLSTGSIVELNCPANAYVDVIVNNCTIARGEVVVVEGNYGVRIDEIISRRERMMLQHKKGLNPGRPMRIGA